MDAVFFGAHPDDVELTSAGLAARLASHGHAVAVVDLTRGEAASRGTVAERTQEAGEAAKELGVERRESLDLPDLGLDAGDHAQLVAVVGCLRRHRPARLLHALYRSAKRPHVIVDVSEVWERRMRALRRHASQLDPARGPETY